MPPPLPPPGFGVKEGVAVGAGFGAGFGAGVGLFSVSPGARGIKLLKAGLAAPPPQPANAVPMRRGSSFRFIEIPLIK